MSGEDPIRELMKEAALLAGHHESNTPISLLVGHFGSGFFPPCTDMPALAKRLLATVKKEYFDSSAKDDLDVYSKCLDTLETSNDRGELSKALYAIIRVMNGSVKNEGEYDMLWRMYTGEAYEPSGREFDVKIIRSEPRWKSPFPCVDGKEHFLEKVEHSYEEIRLHCLIEGK